MEKNVKFSVVTICYNVKDELKRTLRSLWAQTYGSTGADLAGDCGGYESIVVDGGSSDGTAAFLRREKGLRAMYRNPTAGFMTR